MKFRAAKALPIGCRNRRYALCSLIDVIRLFLTVTLCHLIIGVAVAQETTDELPIAPELAQPQVSVEELAIRLVPLTQEQLANLAVVWLGLSQEATQVIADQQASFLADPSLATEEAYQTLARAVETRAARLERFMMVVDSYELKGGDPDRISQWRAYRDGVLAGETALASPRALALAALNWLTRPDGGLAVARDLLVVVLSLVGLLVVARSARGLSRRWFARIPNLSKLLRSFLVGVVYWLVVIIGLLMVLALLGVNVTPLFAMIGGASFILAFAFQDTLGNLASGLMIMINRPFDEGDYVLVGGVGGTVQTVSIVATTVNTGDNQVIVIPNKNVWGNVITNVNASETRRVDLVFGISYDDSIEDATEVITRTVQSHPMVLQSPEPTIRVHELGASSVNFICRPWVQTADYWIVYWDLTHGMKEAFASAGISLPYPQQDVHIRSKNV